MANQPASTPEEQASGLLNSLLDKAKAATRKTKIQPTTTSNTVDTKDRIQSASSKKWKRKPKPAKKHSTDPWSPHYRGGYGDYDDEYGGLWDSRGRGASGVSHYLGTNTSYNYTGYNDGTWEHTDALRFARSLVEIVCKEHVASVIWRQRGWSMSRQSAQIRDNGKTVMLEPKPVTQAVGKAELMDDAKTIVGGNGLHEGAHIQYTPMRLETETLELIKGLNTGEPYHETIAKAALTLVEDSYIEAEVLASFPGYRSYLDEYWRYNMPEAKVEEALTLLQTMDPKGELVPTLLFDIIQDRGRRHTEVPDEQDNLQDLLTEDYQKYIEGATRIMDRVRKTNVPTSTRRNAASAMYELLTKGKIAPEDQGDLGEQAFKPNHQQLEKMEDEMQGLLERDGRIDGEGRGDAEAKQIEGLEDELAQRIQSAIERDMQQEQVEIVTNVGNEMVKVTWIDAEVDAEETRIAQRKMANDVPRLMQKLKFRANTPHRHISAQLRGRMDDSRIVEFPISMANGRPPRAFSRREIISAPKIGIELLVDESGSMGAHQNSRRFGSTYRYLMARNAAALFDAALRQLRTSTNNGVDFAIHGHTTPTYNMGVNRDEKCVVFRIVDPMRPGPERIGSISAHGGNYDGPALAAVAAWAEKQWYDRQRLVLFINDGLPNGDSYGGAPAHDAIRDHCNYLRKRGTEVLMIYLGEGAPHRQLAHMYGPLGVGYIVCEEIDQLPSMVGNVLTRVLKWQA